MPKLLVFCFIIHLLVSCSSNENTKPYYGPFLPDMLDKQTIDEQNNRTQASNFSLPDQIDKQTSILQNKEHSTFNHHVPEATPTQMDKRPLKPLYPHDPNYKMPGSMENEKNYVEYSNYDVLAGKKNAGEHALSFSYFPDTFKYSDERGIFNTSFNKVPKSRAYGILMIGSDVFLYRHPFIDFFFSANVGLGLKQGNGFFIRNQSLSSDSKFNLWMLPVDIGPALEIPVTTYLKFGGMAGYSGMILMQNRSDYADDEPKKRRYQISPGTVLAAKLRLSLSDIFKQNAVALYSQYRITKMYLNLESRYHNYQDFQDKITISGISTGLGLTFEYL